MFKYSKLELFSNSNRKQIRIFKKQNFIFLKVVKFNSSKTKKNFL